MIYFTATPSLRTSATTYCDPQASDHCYVTATTPRT
jgi:hypothetical protein